MGKLLNLRKINASNHSESPVVSEQSRDISIKMSLFFMKLTGFWTSSSIEEDRLRTLAFVYTHCAILYGMFVQLRGLYYTFGDVSEFLYITVITLSITLVLLKTVLLSIHKKGFLDLIVYMDSNFWRANYDSHEKQIIRDCNKVCSFFILFFTFFANGTVVCFTLQPIVENMGRNKSDRKLPFEMYFTEARWLSVSPYFEMVFVAEIATLFHIALGYFCFDNFLCIMNIHVTGQFRILQYRLSKLYEEKMLQTDDHTPDKILLQYTTKCYAALQSCIRQHQALITYCNVLEVVFSKIVLGQVLTFSALICLQGYQLLLSDAHLSRRLLFMCFLTTTMCQLLMFTYSCDGLVQESSGIGTAAYISPWPLLPMSRQGHKLRDDLRMVVIRSRTPCCLTASGFFPISLETYTTVLSTAMSYFTLLRQSTIS